MLIKAGVDISRLKREIRRALQTTFDLLDEQLFSFIVTSTYEGDHGAGSLHYGNDAFDFRLTFSEPGSFVRELKKRLRPGFDIVVEEDHIHIEYDPK